jgi:FtsP/CotA-like multicopper oxidase with cupredoxin domain
VSLSLQASRVSIPDLVAFNARLYCYDDGTGGGEECTYPGPTIVVKPGDTFTLTLENRLGPETGAEQHNAMHWPNTTNVHTHGLHVDPNVDTVFVTIPPGTSRTYVYKIPADHAPGSQTLSQTVAPDTGSFAVAD